MHVLWFMPHDPHGRRRVHSSPPEIRAGRMPEIMEVRVGNPRSTACLVKGDFDIPYWLVFVQQDPLGVQSPLLP